MIRNNLAMDYGDDSIYSASKKLKTIALKGLENLSDSADMATRSALVSSANMKTNVSEFLLGMDIVNNTIALLIGYTERSIRAIRMSDAYMQDPDRAESLLEKAEAKYFPKLVSQFQTKSDNEINNARASQATIYDNLLSGSGIRRVQRRRKGRLVGGAGSKSSGSSVSGSVSTGSILSNDDDESKVSNLSNELEGVLNISTMGESAITKTLSDLTNQISRLNFFFNAKLKPNISQLDSTDASQISKGMQQMLSNFNQINTEFISISSDEGNGLLNILKGRLNQFRIDVDIGLKTWGGIQSGETLQGSGRCGLSGGSSRSGGVQRGNIIGSVFTPYPKKYQHFDAKYLL
jgi:hypothetical protein